jgi:ATP-dependent RNA helicase HelY
MHRWARGDRLDHALSAAAASGAELSAGDFVRWCKQVLDLLEQLAGVPAPGGEVEPLAATARAAAVVVRRGGVAQSMGR